MIKNSKKIICLGLECTAHTFGIGIIDGNGKILANEKEMYQTKSGGMIPYDVAKHHTRVADEVINRALKKANLTKKDITLISFSQGPGMSPPLIAGKNKAKELANLWGLPLIGINHCIAHLTIGQLVTGALDPVFVNVAGANTQIIGLAGDKMRIFGETLDIGMGNAFDKFGREIGLGFPAGPIIEKEAQDGELVELPYSVKGMDLSFSGIVTKATRMVQDKKASVRNMCYSMQETCFAMLIEVTERALAHMNKKEVLIIGGVAANKRLCQMMQTMCEDRKIKTKFYAAPLPVAGDNGAMIAWQGILEFKAGKKLELVENYDILPYWRTDEVKIIW